MSFWRATLSYRTMVSLLATTAIAVATFQAFALRTVGSDFPLSRPAAYSPLLVAVYGGVLALFFAWRLGDRPDGRLAGLFFSLFALCFSLQVVPSQAPSGTHLTVYSISMIWYVVGLRFTMLFPREISQAELQGLGGSGDRRAWRPRLGSAILRFQSLLVSRPYVLWALAPVFVGLWYVRTRYGAAPHYLVSPSASRSVLVQWIALVLVSPMSIAVGGVAVAFLHSGYRLANVEERQKILWIVLGILFAVCLAGAWVSIDYLATLTDVAMIQAFYESTVDFVGSVSGFMLLTGFAVAVLSSGAFDVRPLIDKTVLYGLLGIALLFLFGGVEFALSKVVMARVGAPTGASSWIAGGTVAIAFGPLRKTFKKTVDRWLRDTLPATLLAEGPRRQVVIVFSDVVGYTKLASENEDDALTMLSVFHRAARRAATKQNGSLVKTIGDQVLMEFKETPDAVAALQALSASFAAALVPLDLPEGQLRSGVHFGLVATQRDGDLFGGAVNLASRLEGIAEPGQIVLSQTAADQLADGVGLEDLGERVLKNVAEPVRCWTLPA